MKFDFNKKEINILKDALQGHLERLILIGRDINIERDGKSEKELDEVLGFIIKILKQLHG